MQGTEILRKVYIKKFTWKYILSDMYLRTLSDIEDGLFAKMATARKVSKYRVISGTYQK